MFRLLLVNLALMGMLACTFVWAAGPRSEQRASSGERHRLSGHCGCCHDRGGPTLGSPNEQPPSEPAAPCGHEDCDGCFCKAGAAEIRSQETILDIDTFGALPITGFVLSAEQVIKRNDLLVLPADYLTGTGLRYRLCSLLL